MPLDTSGDALAISNDIGNFKSADPVATVSYLANIETILDAGFQKGTPTMGNVDITPPAGTFKIPYQGVPNTMMPEIIGQACADYWALAIAPKSPQVKSMIKSVVNDAAKIAAPIAANIRSLFARGYLNPTYFDFVNAIHKEVLTIKWTVVEVTPPSSTTLTVNIT